MARKRRIKIPNMNDKNGKRKLLITLLRSYLSKSHIRMKPSIELYLSRIIDRGYIKERHFKQILPYLRIDLRFTDEQLLNYFGDFISNTPDEVHPPPNTLETFLTA